MHANLDKYGYTDGCPRCETMKVGNYATDKNHTEWCRIRDYGEWERAGDPKWQRLSKQVEESYPSEKVDARHVDIENEHEPDMPIQIPHGPMPSHTPSTPGLFWFPRTIMSPTTPILTTTLAMVWIRTKARLQTCSVTIMTIWVTSKRT